MGWLRKKAKQIGKGIKKIGSKIAGAVRKVTRSKAFKIIAAIALATIVGPAAWATWGAGGAGTFAANLSAQTFAVTGGVFGTAAATTAAAPAAVVGSTAAGTAAQQLAVTVPSALGIPATTTAASNAAIAAGTDALSISLATTPATIAQAANVATTAAATNPSVWSTVGNGISKFATNHPILAPALVSTGLGIAAGAINRALTPDQEVPGRMVGESAQERSQLAALQAGYQAQYGRNASQEMMLGMNFGYDSVGYQTTA